MHVYVPRFSTGWRRCSEDDVMALLSLPHSHRENWQAFSDVDGSLNDQRLLRTISRPLLFVGEERADLSRLAVERIAGTATADDAAQPGLGDGGIGDAPQEESA